MILFVFGATARGEREYACTCVKMKSFECQCLLVGACVSDKVLIMS